jgi:hypothetical protein
MCWESFTQELAWLENKMVKILANQSYFDLDAWQTKHQILFQNLIQKNCWNCKNVCFNWVYAKDMKDLHGISSRIVKKITRICKGFHKLMHKYSKTFVKVLCLPFDSAIQINQFKWGQGGVYISMFTTR